jgi:rubrerythrin
VRGEPPVDGTDRERAVEPENAQLFESYADFLARRTTELVVAGRSYAVARAEADAEWTATINRGAKVTAPKEIVCSVCGAARLSPSTPCPDCGNH